MIEPNIYQWFDQSVARHESRIAISCNGRQQSYGELAESCNRIANFLLANKVPQGSLIGVLTQDIFNAIAAILGALKARCAFVPLDPALPAKRMAAVFDQMPLNCVVTDAAQLPTLRGLEEKGIHARIICVD